MFDENFILELKEIFEQSFNQNKKALLKKYFVLKYMPKAESIGELIDLFYRYEQEREQGAWLIENSFLKALNEQHLNIMYQNVLFSALCNAIGLLKGISAQQAEELAAQIPETIIFVLPSMIDSFKQKRQTKLYMFQIHQEMVFTIFATLQKSSLLNCWVTDLPTNIRVCLFTELNKIETFVRTYILDKINEETKDNITFDLSQYNLYNAYNFIRTQNEKSIRILPAWERDEIGLGDTIPGYMANFFKASFHHFMRNTPRVPMFSQEEMESLATSLKAYRNKILNSDKINEDARAKLCKNLQVVCFLHLKYLNIKMIKFTEKSLQLFLDAPENYFWRKYNFFLTAMKEQIHPLIKQELMKKITSDGRLTADFTWPFKLQASGQDNRKKPRCDC